MPPAGSKAPLDFLFAVVVGLIVIACTFFMKPPAARWIVFGVGVIMILSVLAVALPAQPPLTPVVLADDVVSFRPPG